MRLSPHRRNAVRDTESVDLVAGSPITIIEYADTPEEEPRAVLLSVPMFKLIKHAYEALTDLGEDAKYEHLVLENGRMRDKVHSLLLELAQAKGAEGVVSANCHGTFVYDSMFDLVDDVNERTRVVFA